MTTTSVIGQPLQRVDGRAKVTGNSRYAADFNQSGQLYAVVVSATVGLGKVTAIDVGSVSHVLGVAAVISHLNAPRLAYNAHKGAIDPAVGERLHVLQDDVVRFHGQPVAIVVAGTLDQAELGAAALRVTYAAEKPVIDHADPRARAINPDSRGRVQADKSRGNAIAALNQAEVKVDVAQEKTAPAVLRYMETSMLSSAQHSNGRSWRILLQKSKIGRR